MGLFTFIIFYYYFLTNLLTFARLCVLVTPLRNDDLCVSCEAFSKHAHLASCQNTIFSFCFFVSGQIRTRHTGLFILTTLRKVRHQKEAQNPTHPFPSFSSEHDAVRGENVSLMSLHQVTQKDSNSVHALRGIYVENVTQAVSHLPPICATFLPNPVSA